MKVVRRPVLYDAVKNEAGEWVVTHLTGYREYLLPDTFAKLYEPADPEAYQEVHKPKQLEQINKILEGK
jgi:hypothetical protein